VKKKLFILVGLLFLLCGCTAEVNLEVKNDRVRENVTINAIPEGDYTMDRLPLAFRNFIPAYAKDVLADAEPDTKKSGVSYYERKQEQLTNGYKFIYSYNFKLNNYKEARTVKNGFRSSNIYVDNVEKTILLSTDNSGLLYFEDYPFLTDVTVNIKSDYKVVESNADYVNDNVYSWELNRNNNNKNIYLLLDKSAKFDEGYIIDPDEDYEELPDDYDEDDSNGNGGNSTNGNGTSTENNEKENKKKEYSSKIEEEMNENPFVFIVLGIILFIVLILIFTKFAKITKVK